MPRILVVDDEEGFRSFVRYVLEPLGHQVEEADSAASALRALDGGVVDLVLLDGYLNGITGLEILRGLLKADPGIKVALVSVMSFTLEEQALGLGALACLPKPTEPAEMVRLVTQFLGGAYEEA